jgi:hypothetical protein
VSDDGSAAVDVDVEKPHVHHRRLGIPWYDLAIPIAALVVSFISIYIAWHHGQVMKELVHQNERLVEANSLPYLQIDGSNGNGRVTFNATNEGVGPAKIVTAEVLVDGRPVETLNELIHACCVRGDYSGISSSTLQGRMVRPGDTVPYIDFPRAAANGPQLLALDTARKSDRIAARLCYCSVFEDCWIASSRDPTPDPVNQCAASKHPYRE